MKKQNILQNGEVAKKPNEFLQKIKKHKFITIVVALLIIAAIAGIVYGGMMLNKYRSGKAAAINIGDNTKAVEKVLGEADQVSHDGMSWFYYNGTARSLFERISQDSTDQDAKDKLSSITYKFFKVEYEMITDDEGQQVKAVSSVMLDNNHKYSVRENGEIDHTATKAKKARKVNLSNFDLELNGVIADRNISYDIVYSDDSYIKAKLTQATCDVSSVTDYFSETHNENDDTRPMTFVDMNGWSELSVQVRVKTSELIFYESIERKDADGNDITKYVIPDGMTEISKKAFKDWKSLEEVVIPSSVKIIDDEAFAGCSKLKNIVLPEGVQQINDFVFDSCKRLESITFPSSLKSIGKFVFNQCKKMKEINIPSTLEIIGRGAFYQCTKLTINLNTAQVPETFDENWNASKCVVNFKQA